jgi:hypothetical protein
MTNATDTRFFRVEQRDGIWWFIDPDAQLFVSKGVASVSFAPDKIRGTGPSLLGERNREKYGGLEAWRQAQARRLIGWGFNTLGAWSDEAIAAVEVDGRWLAYAPNLNIGAEWVKRSMDGKQAWLQGIFPDVFDSGFERLAREIAESECAPRRTDRRMLGWFTDNELRWGPDWRGSEELLVMFLALPAEAPGRQAAVAMLRERHGDIATFNRAWRATFGSWEELGAAGAVAPPFTRDAVRRQNQEIECRATEADSACATFTADCDAFVGRLAERYFQITHDAVRAADPNHLHFGCRFAYVPPPAALMAAAQYLDVISFNCYDTDPRRVIGQYAATGKPLLIGEFAFRAEQSGLPNTKGAGPEVKTLAERAAAFEAYVTRALGHSSVVGYHWFKHADQPVEGRFDGENSNYGLVTIRDEVYEELVAAMTRVNRQAEQLHGWR